MAFVYKQSQFMPCYHRLRGFFGKEFDPVTRKRRIVFSLSEAYSGVPLELPCGQCIGCKLERSRQWAVRICQELRVHSESAFLTLTYRDECLPAHGSLVKRDLQLFMKRLRKRRPTGIRFFACGEYGDQTLRPHYHVLLLNTSFPDQTFWKVTGDHSLYVSAEAKLLWPKGDHYIGSVTFQSAAYVARYCTKKITGPAAAAHYGNRIPEFVNMSRKPGIGYEWFKRYGEQAYKRDAVVADAREQSIPRYYDDKFIQAFPEEVREGTGVLGRSSFEERKVKRRRSAKVHKADNTPERRRVRERVAAAELARFKREV